jgi:hypothetical protein
MLADSPGETKGIYNENTHELFVYHWDTQKGVGKKYNLSRGFKRSVAVNKVREKNLQFQVMIITKLCLKFVIDLTWDCMTKAGLISVEERIFKWSLAV